MIGWLSAWQLDLGYIRFLLAWLPHSLSIVPSDLLDSGMFIFQYQIWVCMHMYVSSFVCICVCLCICLCLCAYVCVCTYVCMHCECLCVYMCVCLAHAVLRDYFLCVTWRNSQLYHLKNVFMKHCQVLHLPLFIH